jgi:hypothetical protein
MATTYATREEAADCRAAWSWGFGDIVHFVPAHHSIRGCVTRSDSVIYPVGPHRVSFSVLLLFRRFSSVKARVPGTFWLTVNRAAEIATGMICSCLPTANLFVTQILKKGFKRQKDYYSSSGQYQGQSPDQSQLRMHNLSRLSSASRALERTTTATRLASIVEQDALGLFDFEPCHLTTSIHTSRIFTNEFNREQEEGEQGVGTGIQINLSMTQTIENLGFAS